MANHVSVSADLGGVVSLSLSIPPGVIPFQFKIINLTTQLYFRLRKNFTGEVESADFILSVKNVKF